MVLSRLLGKTGTHESFRKLWYSVSFRKKTGYFCRILGRTWYSLSLKENMVLSECNGKYGTQWAFRGK